VLLLLDQAWLRHLVLLKHKQPYLVHLLVKHRQDNHQRQHKHNELLLLSLLRQPQVAVCD
jgi:hypothetical protein